MISYTAMVSRPLDRTWTCTMLVPAAPATIPCASPAQHRQLLLPPSAPSGSVAAPMQCQRDCFPWQPGPPDRGELKQNRLVQIVEGDSYVVLPLLVWQCEPEEERLQPAATSDHSLGPKRACIMLAVPLLAIYPLLHSIKFARQGH